MASFWGFCPRGNLRIFHGLRGLHRPCALRTGERTHSKLQTQTHEQANRCVENDVSTSNAMSMNHNLYKVSAFLALGAIINVAVAWCVELWQPFEEKFQADRCGNLPSKNNFTLIYVVDSGAAVDRVRWLVGLAVPRSLEAESDNRTPPRWSAMESRREFSENATASTPSSQWLEQAAGWPLPSMRGCIEYRAGGPPARTSAPIMFGAAPPPATVRIEHGAEVFKDSAGHLRMISLVPIPAGFVVNTLLFGAVLASIVHAWRYATRFLRRRTGLCAACKYDLRGAAHERCPECGTPVRGSLPPPS